MRTFILASHGKLAEGILNSVEMIVGKQEHTMVFSLNPGEHPQDIAENIEKMIMDKPNMDFIIITDIMGGSVHMSLMKLLKHERVYVISGMNLTMVLELILSNENDSIKETLRSVMDKTKNSIIFANDLLEDCLRGGEDND